MATTTAVLPTANANRPMSREERKVIFASSLGTVFEWYDFYLYGSLSAIIAAQFFSGVNPTAAFIFALMAFAAGFAVRPFGALLFGRLGDLVGRKYTFLITIMIMGLSTFIVGLLPNYASIGVAAPIILFILRFVQGLAVGGQWGGAVLLTTEYAPEGKRGFYGSFAQVGVPIGLVLGNTSFLILSAVLGEETFAAWGWRIPFLLSVVLIGVALYIQLRLEDTPVFRQLQERQEQSGEERGSPVIEVLRDYPKQVLLAAGAFFVVNGAFYVMITGMLDYGTRILGVSQNVMLAAVLISSFAQIFFLTGWSALSDRVGRRPVYLAGAALLGLWAFPMFWLVNTKSAVLITIALAFGQLFLSMMYGPQAALFAEMFSARVRYSGASIGYQGASVFAGGLAPIIMVSLLESTGTSLSVSFYVLAMAAVTFLTVYLITATYGDEMTRDQAGASEEETAATR